MENARSIAAALAFTLATVPAGASMLYKSVGPNGVIQFSDIPPDGASVVLERRPIESIMSVAGAGAAEASAANLAQSVDGDAALARANAQVDLAEHALALARRSMWSELEGLRLVSHRASASEVERVDFYKRGVLAARQNLLDVLRARSAPTVLASR
jgi:hypothetical protein